MGSYLHVVHSHSHFPWTAHPRHGNSEETKDTHSKRIPLISWVKNFCLLSPSAALAAWFTADNNSH